MTDTVTNQDQTQRKPRVALMGEFSAGKSTLSNLLLGEEPFPVKVTATRLPPVWASFGEASAFSVDHDGNEEPLDLNDLSAVSLEDTALIKLYRETEILELCDLIDMPGVSDPNMPADVWLNVIADVDFVVWCTHATQAWRQSEAAIWEHIAGQTNGNNILLVTQIDKIRNDRDRDRVLHRVQKETEGLFQAVYPVSLLKAVQAGDDFDTSLEAGTAAFIEHFVEILMRPVVRVPKPEVVWDVKPELPAKEAAVDRRQVVAGGDQADEHPGAAAGDTADSGEIDRDAAVPAATAPASDTAPIVPRRVRRPGAEGRARPDPAEVAHG